ncbi:MAG TPA: hypothetical protein VFF06_13205, partial [Polyangia bacterium]|nr:hypothetical protein [Polyangia bacterium]
VKYANQGWDKFTSGLMVSFANEDAEGMQQRAAWHEFLADSTHALDGFLQLVFRSLHTGEQGTPLEETSLILSYLQQIRDNADYLAEQISERLLGKKGGSFIQLGGRDQGLPYLSFQFDAIDELYTDEELRKHDPCKPGESSTRSRKAFRENIVVVFVYYLVACASKRSDGRTPLTFRSSFGFARSNLGPTAHTLRLTPGLEERACLDDYVNLIDQFNDELEAFFGDKKNCALILEVVRAGDRTVKPMQTARNRAAIVREFKRAKDYSFHTFMQIVQKYNQPGERNDKEEEDDDGSSRDSNRGGRGRGERKPRPAYVTRKLEGADGSTLTVLSTLGDGDCGIHAMTGTVDPLWGQMREKAPDKLRKQLADAIEKGQVDARKYAALIAELLRALLIKKASGTACTADQTIMWSVIEKNGPLCEALYDAVGADREQMHALGQQREILLKRLLKLIRSAEPAARPLQLALIGEINASNAESDLTLQALFLSLDGAEDPCIALLGSIDESELRDAVESNFDLLHQILGMGGTNVDEFLGYQKSAAQTGNGLLAFVTKWLEHLLPAYAPCVRRRGYYLRQEDLELLAQILGRPLVLVREDDRQPGMFVRVTPAPTVPEVNPLYVFHSGAHFEHAELTLPPKNQ